MIWRPSGCSRIARAWPALDDVAGVGVVALAEHDLARAEAPRHRDLGDAAQVVVRELLEHGHAAEQRGRLLSARGHGRPQHAIGARGGQAMSSARSRRRRVTPRRASPAEQPDDRSGRSTAAAISATPAMTSSTRSASPNASPGVQAPAVARLAAGARHELDRDVGEVGAVVDALQRGAGAPRSRARRCPAGRGCSRSRSTVSRSRAGAAGSRARPGRRVRRSRADTTWEVMSTRPAREVAHAAELREPLDRGVEPVGRHAQLEVAAADAADARRGHEAAERRR